MTGVLLDIGCPRTVVRKELVPQKMIDGAVVTIHCTHGDTVLYPLVMADIEVRGKKMAVGAAISETLSMSLLLGTDVTELGELLGAHSPEKEAGALQISVVGSPRTLLTLGTSQCPLSINNHNKKKDWRTHWAREIKWTALQLHFWE